MKLTLAAGLVLLALSSCSFDPVYAQDCQYTIEGVDALLTEQGTPHAILGPEDLAKLLADLSAAGVDTEGVTGAIVAALNGGLVYGLVRDSCLSAPQPFPAAAPARLSGRTPFGTFA